MEILLNSGKNNFFYFCLESEENYKESIAAIIKSIEDEKKIEIIKIEDEYKENIKKIKEEFMQFNIRSESEVQIMEEKFKIEVHNCVGNMLNLK